MLPWDVLWWWGPLALRLLGPSVAGPDLAWGHTVNRTALGDHEASATTTHTNLTLKIIFLCLFAAPWQSCACPHACPFRLGRILIRKAIPALRSLRGEEPQLGPHKGPLLQPSPPQTLGQVWGQGEGQSQTTPGFSQVPPRTLLGKGQPGRLPPWTPAPMVPTAPATPSGRPSSDLGSPASSCLQPAALDAHWACAAPPGQGHVVGR